MAFFPCIMFCNFAELNQQCPDSLAKARGWDLRTKWEHQLNHSRERQRFYELALKMTAVVEINGLRMIVENPWGEINYTNHWWFNKPKIIDKDRSRRGDWFKKPTAYWFINCDPTHGHTMAKTQDKDMKRISKWDHKASDTDSAKQSGKTGLCSEERSMISPVYAHNFICDFILGKSGGVVPTQLDMFDLVKA